MSLSPLVEISETFVESLIVKQQANQSENILNGKTLKNLKKKKLEETELHSREDICQRCRLKTLTTHTLSSVTNIHESKLFPQPKTKVPIQKNCEIPLLQSLEEMNLPRMTRSQDNKSQEVVNEDIPRTYTLRPSRVLSYKPSLSPRTKPQRKTNPVSDHIEKNNKEPEKKRIKVDHVQPNRSERAKKLRQNIRRLMVDRGQILPRHLSIGSDLLGEGQTSLVYKATHRGLDVACKTGRPQCLKESESKIKRELGFAAKLLACRYVNKYIGSIHCHPNELMIENTLNKYSKNINKLRPTLFVVQQYYPNGDGRTYFQTKKKSIHPFELLNVAICLFSALVDAHSLGIGFVDLKLENLLIDNSGSAYITDFESCVEFHENEQVNLTEEVSWTLNVAAPEMIKSSMFCKPSDVFMATVILAELTAATISDQIFEKKILRRQTSGLVCFTSELIPKQYKHFFPLLETGLDNDPCIRPTAKSALNFLLSMKKN